MLNLTTQMMIAINAQAVSSVSLYDFIYQTVEGGEDNHILVTNLQVPIMVDSYLYLPTPIKHSGITQSDDGKTNNVTVTVGNLDSDRVVQQILENNIVIGNKCIVTQYYIDQSTGNLIPTPLQTTFKITGAKATMGQVDFSLSIGLNFMLEKLPKRQIFGKYCRHLKFKDVNCKYAGADTKCEKTFDDCKAKGNLANFGGFPSIINNRFYL